MKVSKAERERLAEYFDGMIAPDCCLDPARIRSLILNPEVVVEERIIPVPDGDMPKEVEITGWDGPTREERIEMLGLIDCIGAMSIVNTDTLAMIRRIIAGEEEK